MAMQLVLFRYFFVIRVSLNRLWMKMTSASGYYWPAFDGSMHHKLEVPSHFFWDNRYKPKFTNDTSFKNPQQGILILIYQSITQEESITFLPHSLTFRHINSLTLCCLPSLHGCWGSAMSAGSSFLHFGFGAPCKHKLSSCSRVWYHK